MDEVSLGSSLLCLLACLRGALPLIFQLVFRFCLRVQQHLVSLYTFTYARAHTIPQSQPHACVRLGSQPFDCVFGTVQLVLLRDAVRQLEEPFLVVVVGEFNSGKSRCAGGT